MKFDWNFRRFFIVLITLCLIWGIFITSRFITGRSNDPNLKYIPSDASYSFIIRGDEVLKDAIYDIVLKSTDDQLYKLLKKELEHSRKNEKNGIDFFSSIILTELTADQKKYNLLLLNLNNKDYFQKTIGDQAGNQSLIVCNSNVAAILFSDTPLEEEQRGLLQKKLELLLKKPSESHPIPASSSMFTYKRPVSSHPVWGEGNIQGSVRGNTIILTGRQAINTAVKASAVSLSPKGFHVSASLFDPKLRDTLSYWLRSNQFNLPPIVRIGVNYQGMVVENGAFVPQADLLLETDGEIDILSLTDESKWQKLGIQVEQSTPEHFLLKTGSSVLHLKKIGKSALFIGTDLSHVRYHDNGDIFLIQGDLKNITKVQGGGFLTLGLNMYAPFRWLKDFSQPIQKCEIQLKRNGAFHAELRYEDDKTALAEFLKMIITIKNDLKE